MPRAKWWRKYTPEDRRRDGRKLVATPATDEFNFYEKSWALIQFPYTEDPPYADDGEPYPEPCGTFADVVGWGLENGHISQEDYDHLVDIRATVAKYNIEGRF